MASIKYEVSGRNSFGRYRAATSAAATRTIKKAVEDGADLSRGFAPVGHKHDRRTVPLKDSIDSVMVSRTKGFWRANARHAAAQEHGAVPHIITGNVTFWWENAGRFWQPADTEIFHPGHGAQPFLAPAAKIIAARMSAIAKRYYPG